MRSSLRTIGIGIGIGMFGLAGASQAQIPTSTRDSLNGNRVVRGEAARTDPAFRHMIACTVDRQPARTRALIDTRPGSYEEDRIVHSFDSRLEQCLAGIPSLGVSWVLIRAGIAEVYYRREFPNGLAASPAPDPARAAAWSRARVEGLRNPQMELLHAMARCVVLRQPEAVGAALAAEPMSAGESAAIRTLQQSLGACLDSGVQFTASRQSLRGLLAEAALHFGEARRNGFSDFAQAAAQ
jgi:hypothetical protein